ncbi:haloacid dehalogenase [Agrocybe pediades]|nr:haloacid dehalogenase [Agrocybe pediades]
MPEIKALVFDAFGTTVDWRSSMVQHLEAFGKKTNTDWTKFAQEWRTGYMVNTKSISQGGPGPLNTDKLHRQLLEDLLKKPEWKHIADAWDESSRDEITFAWHYLKAWPDVVQALRKLKEKYIITTLSNGNMRLLIDMAKHADLPWDAVLSAEMFGAFKPAPQPYQSTLQHLSVAPSQCVMVAAHLFDLKGAAAHGMRTVYVNRPDEDPPVDTGKERVVVKAGAEWNAKGANKSVGGGEEFAVDAIVDSFEDLVEVLEIMK